LDRGRLDRSDNRLVTGEMEKSLGQTIVTINQPARLGREARWKQPRTVTPGRPARRRISAPGALLDKFLINYAR
jgi:hypothetical protein